MFHHYIESATALSNILTKEGSINVAKALIRDCFMFHSILILCKQV